MPRESKVGLETLRLVRNGHLDATSRLVPPEGLTEEQQAEFLRVVNSLPADWFAPAHLQMLVQYCRHVVIAKKLAQAIDMMLTEAGDVRMIGVLMTRQENASRILHKLMTSLRITPQSIEPPKVSHKKVRQSEVPFSD